MFGSETRRIQAEIKSMREQLQDLQLNASRFGWTTLMMSRRDSLNRSIAALEAKLAKK